MLPNFKQRLALALTSVIAGVVLIQLAGGLRPADGSDGLVLFDARIGPVLAVLGLAGLVAVVAALALPAAAMGNRLGGVFVVAAGLALFGINTGPADGWYHRAALPTGFWMLAVETLVYLALWIGVLALLRWATAPVAHRLPRWLRSAMPAHETTFALPGGQAWIGGGVAAVIGGVVSALLLRSTDVGQVTGALILGFTIGGVVARASAPQATPVVILLSPLATAIAAYGYLATQYLTADAVLAAKYTGQILGLGLALPIHYAAAGVVGTAIGVGMGQGLEHNYHETARQTDQPAR